MRRTQTKILGACAIIAVVGQAVNSYAGVLEFTDKDDWIAAVGPFTTIDFTGFPNGTFITDQYSEVGAVFTDGNDSIHIAAVFENDGAGLDGNGDTEVAFLSPQAWLAADFPGDLQIDLYVGDQLLHSSVFIAGGAGNFAGIVSTDLFDRVILIDPSGPQVAIDDLHFGVPTPGAIWLLGLAALCPARRRRC
jgi:hypothetical protein